MAGRVPAIFAYASGPFAIAALVERLAVTAAAVLFGARCSYARLRFAAGWAGMSGRAGGSSDPPIACPAEDNVNQPLNILGSHESSK
jgi:hypothetical protein